MKRIVMLLILIAVLTSCETLVSDIPEARLPKASSKLVVHSFISPQSPTINVVVSESVPIFSESGAKQDVIKDAVVKLSDGTAEVVMPFDPDNDMYRIAQSAFKITPSKTYTLTVSHDGRQVTAHCTVPENTPVIKSYEVDIPPMDNYVLGQAPAITLKMHWQDIPNESNYYRVMAAADVEYSVPDTKTKGKRQQSEFNFIWNMMSAQGEWQTDKDRDGGLFYSPVGRVSMPSFHTSNPTDGSAAPFNPDSKLISITMLLYNADENYYKYHRSLQQRLDTENPFTEPSQIYSNIEGGLGCFGAYNTGKLVYRPE